MSSTRVVRVRPGLRRQPAENFATQLGLIRPTRLGPPDAKKLFVARFPGIRQSWARYSKQGVVIFAFDERDDPIGEVWIEASLDKTRAAVIGRHSMCDLMVPSEHMTISLRHLVVFAKAVSHDAVKTRVLDLATKQGFIDEAGRTLQAVTSDGPLFLRTGTIDLMMLMTPEVGALPDDPEAAYGALPQRVFFEEIEGLANAAPRRLAPPAVALGSQTIVRATSGPVVAAKDLCGDEEIPCGTITLRSGGQVTRREVGARALERGVLIGRYSRCDFGAVEDERPSELSRVHVLLVKSGEDVLAIDTASTNGTTLREKMRKIARLHDGDVLELSGELQVVWNT